MTTQTRFTPGKWQNMEGFPCYVETEAGLPIAVTHPHHIANREAVDGADFPDLDECIANGILLAASPKLYTALEMCADAINRIVDFTSELPSRIELIALHEAAISVLKQARGEV
jgi:hypothetical protein